MTEYLRRYALFATARTIGIHPGSLPFGLSSGIGGSNAARSGCRGIGLSEAFSTWRPDIRGLCCFGRQRGSKKRNEQSDGGKSSRTEYGCLLEGNYAQRVWWPGTSWAPPGFLSARLGIRYRARPQPLCIDGKDAKFVEYICRGTRAPGPEIPPTLPIRAEEGIQ